MVMGYAGISPADIQKLIDSGAPKEEIDRAMEIAKHEQTLYLSDDQATAVYIFSRCGTQWNRNPMSNQRIGLNYDGVLSVANALNFDITPQAFDALQSLERFALKAESERDRSSSVKRQVHRRQQ